MWREKTGFFLGRVVWSGSFLFLLPFFKKNFFDEMPSVWLSCRLCSGSAAHRGKWEKKEKRDENIFPGSFSNPLSFPFLVSLFLSRFIWLFLFNNSIHPVSFFLVFSFLLHPDRSPHRQRVEKTETDRIKYKIEEEEEEEEKRDLEGLTREWWSWRREKKREGVRLNIFSSRQLSRRW